MLLDSFWSGLSSASLKKSFTTGDFVFGLSGFLAARASAQARCVTERVRLCSFQSSYIGVLLI